MTPALLARSAWCDVPLTTHCYVLQTFASIATELDLHLSLGCDPEINKNQDQHLTQSGTNITASSPTDFMPSLPRTRL